MNIIISLRSEILKTRRTIAFYLTLITAALIPFIFFLDVCFDGVSQDNRVDPMNALVKEGFGFLSVMILPMFVILLCTFLPQIEYRNNTWKQVFASPQTRAQVFIARFLNVHLLILLFMVSYNVFMGMVAIAIHFLDPALDILHQPLDLHQLLTFNLNAYLAVLAISAIQFWLGLRFKNFIIPIAIGFSCWLTGTMMALEFHTANAHYFPYTHLIFSFFPNFKHLVGTVQLFSAGYMVLFLLLAYLDFKRRQMKA